MTGTARAAAVPLADPAAPVRPPRKRPTTVPPTPVPASGGGDTSDRRAHFRTYQMMLSALAVLALLTVCGLGSWLIVQDERKGTDARAAGTPEPTVLPRDITSRTADPAPLTADEVFPKNKQIVINPAEPPYRILRTQVQKNCRTGAAGEIAKLLTTLGCNQVVRATMRSPTGAYLVTGGLFNLEDRAGAEFAREKIQPIVNARKGRFAGMMAGKGTEPVVTSSAHVGWDIRGHYLLYCVIARADGKALATGDPYARQILYDIVEMHLRDNVLAKRATVTVSPGASPSRVPS
ncbi:MAG TPA: hypothetical protein VES42_18630 [Pilimelia sp.]|nr:hypothetical protein [Pilimelia sp.]